VADIYEADTWAGMIFALVLLWAAFGIIRDALQVLSDATPTDVDMVEIRAELLDIPAVTDVHHLHARTISGPVRTLSGHMVLDDLSAAPAVLDAAKLILEDEHGFSLTTLQLEPTDLHESDPSQLEPDESHRSSDGGHPHAG
jgi:cobalt-zinc-cadmium efflux system protein